MSENDSLPPQLKRLWLAQFLSLLGTDITRFALRIWTFSTTKSTFQFALITFFSEMPSILASPITGGWIDLGKRKYWMLLSDTLAALATLSLYFLWSWNGLDVKHVYIANIVQSLANSIQWPAFLATVTLLVNKEQLVKVNGFNQAANGLSMMIAPLIAGWLLTDHNAKGLSTVFFIEFITFILAFIITYTTPLPEVKDSVVTNVSEGWSSTLQAWKFIRGKPALLALLLLLAQAMFLSGMVQILMAPLVLGFSTPLQLGNVLTFSGVGAMLGFILPTKWGGPKENKIRAVLACMTFQGLLLSMVGLFENIYWVLFVALSYMFVVPLNRALRESIWQNETPADMQGRVFSLQQSIQKFALPIAALAAGPICDWWFEPMMQQDSILSKVFWMFGQGKGRGAAVLFAISGLVNVFTVLFLSRMDIIWNMDSKKST